MVDRALEKHRAKQAIAASLCHPDSAAGGICCSPRSRTLPGRIHNHRIRRISPGSLYASGLIAAGGIVGLLGVCVKLYEAATDRSIPRFSDHNPLHHDWISVLMFALLAYSLYYFARKPLKDEITLNFGHHRSMAVIQVKSSRTEHPTTLIGLIAQAPEDGQTQIILIRGEIPRRSSATEAQYRHASTSPPNVVSNHSRALLQTRVAINCYYWMVTLELAGSGRSISTTHRHESRYDPPAWD